jgi:NADH:ubiquinone oxidoreductase subunit 2 (subunit N)
MPLMFLLIALMFKLGAAPLHLWMIDIYSGVKRQLLMYISTAPKLSLFGFWVSTWHSVWTDLTVLMFVAFSMIIGCFGAYSQPTLRSLFAYSTVNEIGLMLMAIETAGFHSLFQHLTIYIVTMLLLWNNSDKRLFAILAISLAGLPPLAGFFGKAWIFNSVATGAMAGPYIGILAISLFCTCLSLVYYLRVFRLFSMSGISSGKNIILPTGIESNAGVAHNMGIETRTYGYSALYLNVKLTSFCVIFLIFAPLFYIKPFVL